MKRVAVFCGSKLGHDPVYRETAVRVAQVLARRGAGLVFGGGKIGLMGVLADAALAAGAEVIGVIPQFMMAHEVAHLGVTRLEVVDSMHLRKARMAELADAFLALPGGYGTLDELFEIITWAQLRLHDKPIGLLNVNGYFDALSAWVENSHREGFISDKHRRVFMMHPSAEPIVDMLLAAESDPGADTRFV